MAENNNHVSCHCLTGEEHFTPRAVFEVGQNATRYRFRIISNGMVFCPLRLSIDHHKLIVIASDGRPFEPFLADSLVLFNGERFDFLLAETVSPPANHWLRITGLGDCSDSWFSVHQEAILRYTGAPLEAPPESDEYQTQPPGGEEGMELNPLNQNLTIHGMIYNVHVYIGPLAIYSMVHESSIVNGDK